MHLFCVQVVPLHLSQMQFFGLCDREEEYVLGHYSKVSNYRSASNKRSARQISSYK